MPADLCTVPIKYTSISHEVTTTRNTEHPPQTIHTPGRSAETLDEPLTLIDLLEAVGEVTADEQEIVATVLHMLESGRVRLCGESGMAEGIPEDHRVSA